MSGDHILRRRGQPAPPPAPPRSPERQRLADVIAARAEAVEQANRVEEARGRIDDRLFEQLQPAVRTAMDELDHARTEVPRRLIAAVLGETEIANPVAAAERALDSARAAVAEARQARSMLSDEATDCEVAIRDATHNLEQAIVAAVAADPAVAALFAEFDRARLRLTGLARTLLSLPDAAQPRELRVRGLAHQVDGFTITVARQWWEGSEQRFVPDPVWASAIAVLRHDADAPLPNLPAPEPDDATDIGTPEAA